MSSKDKIRESKSLMNLSPLYRQLHLFSLYPGYYLSEHKHVFYHINLILSGTATLISKGKEHNAGTGNIIVLPPNIEHTLYTKDGYSQIGIDMYVWKDSTGLCDLFCSSIPKGIFTVPITDYYRFSRPERFFNDLSELNRIKAINYMDAILIEVISSLKKKVSDGFKDRFLELMSQKGAYNLSVGEICQRLNLSKTHLERLTRKEFSCTAKEYCDKIKLMLLCQYLEQTNMTSGEICDEIGFCDESHLTTFFKRHMKRTPTDYRRNART